MKSASCTGMTVVLLVVMMMMRVRGDASFIEQTCKQTPNFNLCVSLLKSDPRGSSADTTGLALILVDHIKALATKTAQEIDGLYKRRTDLREALISCNGKYRTILESDVPEAVEALTKGVPKFAEDGVADAAIEAAGCDRAFKGKSPFTRLTKSLQDVSDVARAIIRMLL